MEDLEGRRNGIIDEDEEAEDGGEVEDDGEGGWNERGGEEEDDGVFGRMDE
jgi:hypothetical protein